MIPSETNVGTKMTDVNKPMDVTDFRAMTDALEKNAADTHSTPKLTILGYDVEGVELVIACAGDEGVVLSLGDTRVSLTQPQLNVLKVLLDAFNL